VLPWLKFTVPDGVPPAADTVAVKVTLVPEVALPEEDVSVVVVVAGVALDVPLPPAPVLVEELPEPALPPPQPERTNTVAKLISKNKSVLRPRHRITHNSCTTRHFKIGTSGIFEIEVQR
jgi:hypothetical protein